MRTVWTVLALFPLILGLIAMIGWITHIPFFIRFYPEFLPVVFNTAICLILSGITLLLILNSSGGAGRALQIILGTLILAISSIVLVQNISGINLGVDQLFMEPWPNNMGIHPGRMAVNTSLCFIFLGLAFILVPYADKKWQGIVIEICIFLTFVISVIGVMGYLLHFEFLYTWYSYSQMSLGVAISFIAMSFCLWGYWHQTGWAARVYEGRQDTKIIILSSAVLLCVTLIVGIASFITVAQQQVNRTGQTFQNILQDKISLFETEVNHVFQVMDVIRNNLIFNKYSASPIPVDTMYKDLLNLFLAEGFSAVKISDKAGTEIVSLGDFLESANFSFRLKNTPLPALLMWKNGWYLQISTVLNSNDANSYVITAQWPLYNIDIALASNQIVGETSSILVCGQNYFKQVNCYSSQLDAAYTWPKTAISQFLPIDYALAGQSGILTSYDYERVRLLTAYAPLGKFGLAMIIGIDTEEIYKPVKENLRFIFPIIVLAIIIGLLLMRLQVIPLVRRVVKAEQELLRANKRLQESDERYAVAIRGSHVGLWDWRVGAEQVFYSPYFKTMLGYSEHEVPPKIDFFYSHLHPDDYDRLEKALQDHLEHYVPFDIEYRLRTKAGDYHWFRAVGEALRDDHGVAVRMAGSLTDITERKKAEQRLSAQYAVITTLSEATTIEKYSPQILQSICEMMEWEIGILWLADYESAQLNCIGYWHQSSIKDASFEETLCHSAVQIGVGLPGRVWSTAQPAYVFDINVDRHFPQSAKELGLHSVLCFPIVINNKVLGVMEFFTRRKQIPDESLIKMMSAIGTQIGQFIQRKSTERALRESESYKTAIFESASDSIMAIDEYGGILSFNPLTTEIFGYGSDELKTMNIDVLIPGITAKLLHLPTKRTVEATALRKDGQDFSVEISASTMHLNNQNVYVAIVRDITERKKIEKLKNEFVSVVSHELRTPLTSIRGAIGLILGGTVDDSPAKRNTLLTIANNNCDRLLLLINDILDTDKIESGKMRFQFKVVNINQIVEEAIAANKFYADKFDVKVELTQQAHDVLVNVDSTRLIQVLTNLISNAVKFSPPNESVKITITAQDELVRVSVADKGPGIPVEFQSKIFQKFSQADSSMSREKGGTGLGLSISQSLIEKMGGRLNFTSKPNQGTIFYFDLPQWLEESPTAPVLTEAAPASNRGTLLICEDDESQARYLSELLRSAGFDTRIAYTVAEARELLAVNDFKALLLDLILPDQDGIAFIRELREIDRYSTLPIIVISMIAESGRALLNGEAISVIDWLDKPINFNKLLKAIDLIKKQSNTETATILHVEDDLDTQNIIKTLLQGRATLLAADSIHDAEKILAEHKIDLVILDLLLPDGSGVDLLPLLAKRGIPIIVFSAIELDQEYAKYVQQSLIKSETSNQELLEMINNILEV